MLNKSQQFFNAQLSSSVKMPQRDRVEADVTMVLSPYGAEPISDSETDPQLVQIGLWGLALNKDCYN